MKKVLCLGLLLALFGLGGCQSMEYTLSTNQSSVSSSSIDWSKAGPDAQKHQISFDMVVTGVENGAKFYDVRSASEFAEKNFGITENWPLTDMEVGLLPDVDKDTPIHVHCLKGIRSAQATELLRQAGFTQVFDLGGVEHVEAIGGLLK